MEYSKQLRYQQSLQIKDVQESLRKILHIWSPTSGLKVPIGGGGLEVTSSDSQKAEIEISKSSKLETRIKKPVTRNLDSDNNDERTLDMILDDPSRELHALLVETGYRANEVAAIDDDSSVVVEIASGALEETKEIQNAPPQALKEPEVMKILTYAEYVSNILTAIESSFTDGVNSKTGRVSFSDEVSREQITPMEGVEDENVLPVLTEGTSLTGKDLDNSFGLFSILIESDDDSKTVYTNTMALLPPPKAAPMDSSAIPASCVFQILRKPYPRMARRAAPRFSILDIEDVSLAKSLSDAVSVSEARSVITPVRSLKKMSIKPSSAKTPTEDLSLTPVPGTLAEPSALLFDDAGKHVLLATRWIIKPFSSVQMKIRFRSEKEGKSEAALGFEVVGTGQSVTLLCQGNCEVPHITNDPRNIFMRRMKAAPPGLNAPPPQKRFLMAENVYSFGPLQMFKKADWR